RLCTVPVSLISLFVSSCCCFSFFFFHATASSSIYSLSLHDALPILTFPILASLLVRLVVLLPFQLLRLSLATPSRWTPLITGVVDRKSGSAGMPRPISYAVFCLKKKKTGDEREVLRGMHEEARQDER